MPKENYLSISLQAFSLFPPFLPHSYLSHLLVSQRKELNDQQTLYGYYPKQQSPDHKFLLIPFAFLILRLGGLVFSVCYIYTNWWHRMSPILQAIIYFAMVRIVKLTDTSYSGTSLTWTSKIRTKWTPEMGVRIREVPLYFINF